jgi:hypothetical protein
MSIAPACAGIIGGGSGWLQINFRKDGQSKITLAPARRLDLPDRLLSDCRIQWYVN